MFLVDDILGFPVKGILYVFKELHQAVEQEAVNQAEAIRAELSELYLRLETGQLTEEEFDRRESELLDLLDLVEARGQAGEEEEDDDGDDEGPDPADVSRWVNDPPDLASEPEGQTGPSGTS